MKVWLGVICYLAAMPTLLEAAGVTYQKMGETTYLTSQEVREQLHAAHVRFVRTRVIPAGEGLSSVEIHIYEETSLTPVRVKAVWSGATETLSRAQDRICSDLKPHGIRCHHNLLDGTWRGPHSAYPFALVFREIAEGPNYLSLNGTYQCWSGNEPSKVARLYRISGRVYSPIETPAPEPLVYAQPVEQIAELVSEKPYASTLGALTPCSAAKFPFGIGAFKVGGAIFGNSVFDYGVPASSFNVQQLNLARLGDS